MHLSLLSGRVLQAGPFPSTSDVPSSPKHHSFLASGGIAVVVILVVFPVLLIGCLIVCRWRPRQMPIRSGLDAPSPITVIVPPPPIDEPPPLISMDDRPEFYDTRLQRFPLNRQALWREIMPLSLAPSTPLAVIGHSERPSSSRRTRSRSLHLHPTRRPLTPRALQTTDSIELTTFPSLSLGLGIAVAVALPRQLPEAGRMRTSQFDLSMYLSDSRGSSCVHGDRLQTLFQLWT
ncbi:hypothetical protein BC629DRAFT_431997 [Irpex lacteus]|nr:hypothetical protein BC629DRAFT_431997 [Irpex lacteus]